MRANTIWRAGLLAGFLAIILGGTPSTASAQEGTGSPGYAPPDTIIPWPLGSSRPEDGGFFIGAQLLLWRQTNPLRNEVIATRGFFDINSQDASAAQFGSANFIGSGTVALDTNQVRGPGSYQPGFVIPIGWKFEDGSSLTLSWTHLFQYRYSAVATAAAPNLNVRADFADSFITAPVFNFPNDFALPFLLAQGPNGVATYGIWDGASIMTESFVQRTEAYDLIWRMPLYEQQCYRFSSLLGPRFFWIWENFQWRTTNFGFIGGDGPSANYSNIDSNRMYGWNFGCSQEWYIGHGFAIQLDTSFAPFVDVVKERTQYSTEQKFSGAAESKRARTDYTFVPEVEAKLSLAWYPTENVQLNIGYDILVFFNTINAQEPVDFNYSSVDPKFDRVMRVFDGLQAAVIFSF